MHRRNIRAIIAVLMAVLLIGAASSALADNSYSFKYATSNGRKEITGYSGTLPAVLEIPDDVTDIGYNAFGMAGTIKEVIMPNSLTRIGAGAFGYCSSLTTFHIPDSVTTLENSALYACEKLSDVTLGNGLTFIGPYALCGAAMETLTIPDGVTTLSSGALSQCRQLKSVSLPLALDSIEQEAFYMCTDLRNVEFRGSLTTIGTRAFYDCNALGNIVLPEGLRTIGDYGFAFCGLQTIYIPGSVTHIGQNAFQANDSLRQIQFGGTADQWANLTHGSTGISSGAEVICNAAPSHSVTPAPGFPQPDKETGWVISQHANGLILTGITAEKQDAVTAGALAARFTLPDNEQIKIYDRSGVVCQTDKAVATGDQFELTSDTGRRETVTIIVRGDVLGTGKLDIAQLVHMAKSLTGQTQLSWPYELAGTLVGTGKINIADLVAEAQLLIS